MRASHLAVPLICSRQNRAEAIVSLRVGSRPSPAEKPGIGLRGAWIQFVPKNSVRVRLPDFNDGVHGRLATLFQDTPGKQNVLAAGDLSPMPGQIVEAVGKLVWEERPDSTVRRRRHQSSSGVERFPRSTKSRWYGISFTAPISGCGASKISRCRASSSCTPFKRRSISFNGSPGKNIWVT